MLNLYDAFIITLYFVSLILRLVTKTKDVGHVLYAFDAGFWWVPAIYNSSVRSKMGRSYYFLKFS